MNRGIAKHAMEQCGFLKENMDAHAVEHSIEVQLPFLQHKFGGKGKGFDFVPVSIMNTDYSEGFMHDCEKLGKAIAMMAKKHKIGIVASSDFSHYVPKEEASGLDGKAMKKILKLDVSGFFRTLDLISASVCGYGPIAVLMSAARALGLKGRLLHSSTSGDVTGDDRLVVAYHAIGFG